MKYSPFHPNFRCLYGETDITLSPTPLHRFQTLQVCSNPTELNTDGSAPTGLARLTHLGERVKRLRKALASLPSECPASAAPRFDTPAPALSTISALLEQHDVK